MRALRSAAISLALALGSLLLTTAAAARPIFLAEDLREAGPDRGSFTGGEAVSLGDRVLFVAEDLLHGGELWVSNGTPEGTRLVADVCPGRCFSQPRRLTAVDDRLFFTATDGISGRRLWVTDGTREGTRRLTPLSGDYPSFQVEMATLDGELYFSLRNEKTGLGELWRSDGTPEGTGRAFEGGPESFSDFHALGGHLYFVGRDEAHGTEVWRTDGTLAGTTLVVDACPQTCSSTPDLLAVVGESLYFAADGEVGGRELWVTDGTAGGTRRFDLVPGAGGMHPAFLAELGGEAYFYSELPSSGIELVRSDGTAEGTEVLEGVLPYSGDGLFLRDARVLGEQVFLAWADTATGPGELWLSDGAGSRRLGPVFETAPRLLAVAGGRLFFGGDTPESGDELWVSDGTSEGTRQVLDASAGAAPAFPTRGVAFGQALFYQADDGATSFEPWVSDGTAAGTRRVKNVLPAESSSRPFALEPFGAGVAFAADVESGRALLATAGAPGGARELLGLDNGPSDLEVAGGRLFFVHDFPSQLWASDGTAAGTRFLASSNRLRSLEGLGDQVFFASDLDAARGQHLWASAGTPGGTERVRTLNADWQICPFLGCPQAPYLPQELTRVGARLFLTGYEEGADPQLWASDGTEAGTLPVKEFQLADDEFADLFMPRELTAAGDRLFFVAYEETSGWQLWTSDGTEAGTRRLSDFDQDLEPEDFSHLTPFAGELFFAAGRPGEGQRLWRSDGTAAGTVPVRELSIGGLPGFLVAAATSGPRLFLSVYVDSTGAELWASDGTAAGTGLVVDLLPGPASSQRGEMLGLGDGRLLFAATDGVTGMELWLSDGTAAGTVQVEDLAPGTDPSSPEELTRSGERIFFSADDGVHGRELFGLEVADLGELPTCPSERLCLGGGRFEVTVSWRDFQGNVGPGVPVPGASDDSGLLWFFAPENWELMVKVLDGCAVNGHFWVLAAATTNVEYTLTVSDTLVPRDAVYANPLGRASPAIIDTRAFSCP